MNKLKEDPTIKDGIFLKSSDNFMDYLFITDNFIYGIFKDGLILRRSRKVQAIDFQAQNYLREKDKLAISSKRLLTSDYENLRNFARLISGLTLDKEIVIL